MRKQNAHVLTYVRHLSLFWAGREALGSIGSFLSFQLRGSLLINTSLHGIVCFEYCSVMYYGGRLRLSFLCFLSPLYVVVFTACPPSQFTNSNGTISSPGFNTSQSYDHNLTCTYRITVPANRWVVLEIIKLSILGTMPDCQGDSLEILVG